MVAGLAVEAGLAPRQVLAMEADEYEALLHAVEERNRRRAWTNTSEAVVAAVEALWAIIARLDAGIPVVQTDNTKKAEDYGRYPRPPWIETPDDESSEEGEVVVGSLRDALKLMRGGTADGRRTG